MERKISDECSRKYIRENYMTFAEVCQYLNCSDYILYTEYILSGRLILNYYHGDRYFFKKHIEQIQKEQMKKQLNPSNEKMIKQLILDIVLIMQGDKVINGLLTGRIAPAGREPVHPEEIMDYVFDALKKEGKLPEMIYEKSGGKDMENRNIPERFNEVFNEFLLNMLNENNGSLIKELSLRWASYCGEQDASARQDEQHEKRDMSTNGGYGYENCTRRKVPIDASAIGSVVEYPKPVDSFNGEKTYSTEVFEASVRTEIKNGVITSIIITNKFDYSLRK